MLTTSWKNDDKLKGLLNSLLSRTLNNWSSKTLKQQKSRGCSCYFKVIDNLIIWNKPVQKLHVYDKISLLGGWSGRGLRHLLKASRVLTETFNKSSLQRNWTFYRKIFSHLSVYTWFTLPCKIHYNNTKLEVSMYSWLTEMCRANVYPG